METMLRTQLEQHRAALEEQEKKVPKPLAEQVAGCQAYIARARKRADAKAAEVDAAQAAVRTLTAELEALETDISEHESHARSLEEQMLAARLPPPALAAAAAPAAKLLEQVAAIESLLADAARSDAVAAEDYRDVQALNARLRERLGTGPDAQMGDDAGGGVTATPVVDTAEDETLPASPAELATATADDAIAAMRGAANRPRPAPY